MSHADTAIMAIDNPQVAVEHLNLFYGASQALKDMSFGIPQSQVTSLSLQKRIRKCFNGLTKAISPASLPSRAVKT